MPQGIRRLLAEVLHSLTGHGPGTRRSEAFIGRGEPMAAAARDEIQQLLSELPGEGLERVRNSLVRLRDELQRDDISPYHRRLLEAGIVTRIPRIEDRLRPSTFERIEIEGQSVSETLIEDRS